LNSSIFPFDLQTNLAPTDQSKRNRFVVINGIGSPVCLGPNVVIDDVQVENVIYQGNMTTATVTLRNKRDYPTEEFGGNIPITSVFDVAVYISNQTNLNASSFIARQWYSGGLAVNGSVSIPVNFTITNTTNNYTLTFATNTLNSLDECATNDNRYYANVSIVTTANVTVRIDGVATTAFARPYVPYTVAISLIDSQSNPLANATIYLTETNGLNLQTGLQITNISVNSTNTTKSGTISIHQTILITDYLGQVNLTYVPTYNPLYTTAYNSLDVESYIGNYSLQLSGVDANGIPLLLRYANTTSFTLNLTITNPLLLTAPSQKEIQSNTTVALTYDYIYRTFVNFLRSIG